VVSVPLRRTQAGRLIMTVQVDGHSLTAILDTGAAGTIMTRQAAARLGVTPALLALDSADTGHGVDMNDIPVRRHRFASVRIGRELFRDVPLAVADVQLGGPDMLLGFDYLRQRRAWISYATGRMYVQAAPTRPALDRSPAHSWAGILVR
jgi:clan AA aspartic protease (TIGR02281 family)